MFHHCCQRHLRLRRRFQICQKIHVGPRSLCGYYLIFIPSQHIVQCETATRCPDGDECADDEFCFIDFVCDPMQISTNNPISSTVNPHDSATSQPGNGCELCGARIDGPRYDIRRNMTVDVYGHEISCADLSIKILLMYGPASDQCLEIVGTHSIHCWCVISSPPPPIPLRVLYRCL
jgi:hypothetical protein